MGHSALAGWARAGNIRINAPDRHVPRPFQHGWVDEPIENVAVESGKVVPVLLNPQTPDRSEGLLPASCRFQECAPQRRGLWHQVGRIRVILQEAGVRLCRCLYLRGHGGREWTF